MHVLLSDLRNKFSFIWYIGTWGTLTILLKLLNVKRWQAIWVQSEQLLLRAICHVGIHLIISLSFLHLSTRAIAWRLSIWFQTGRAWSLYAHSSLQFNSRTPLPWLWRLLHIVSSADKVYFIIIGCFNIHSRQLLHESRPRCCSRTDFLLRFRIYHVSQVYSGDDSLS